MRKKSVVTFFISLLLVGGVITAIVLINKKKEEERKAEEERLYLEKSTKEVNDLWKKIDVNIKDDNYLLDLKEGIIFDLSLTSDKEELFEDDIIELPETISRTEIASNDGYFYLEFNKNIKLPSSYELDENGYIKIGTITCFRKGQ
jgi:hypothetical protein